MKKFMNKLLSIMLTLAMAVSIVPCFSVDVSATNNVVEYVDESGAVQHIGDGYTVSSYTEISADQSSEQEWSSGWYVVTGEDVQYTAGISAFDKDIKLILCDGAKLTINNNGPALQAGSLTIYGQSKGTGTLVATSNVSNCICTTNNGVTICGGKVEATGISGIQSYGNVTIYGGKVTAVGTASDNSCAGIYSEMGNITINGGKVTALDSGTWAMRCASYGKTITIASSLFVNAGNDSASATETAYTDQKYVSILTSDYGWYYSDTSATEFTVSNIDELEAFAYIVNSGICNFSGKTVKLSGDFENKDKDGNDAALTTPIGNNYVTDPHIFYGTFDGNGKTVNLNITEYSFYAGLFGYVYSGTIQNVNTTGTISINSTEEIFAGGVAGMLCDGTIKNCSSDCNITVTGSSVKAGGVVGYNYGYDNTSSVVNCYATGDVSATATGDNGGATAGGVVGYNRGSYPAYILNCYAAGNITATMTGNNGGADAGGVVGLNVYVAAINYCYAAGTVSANATGLSCGSHEGNVFGYNTGTVNDCYSIPKSQMKAAAGEEYSSGDAWTEITVNGTNLGAVSLADALNTYVSAGLYAWGVMNDDINDGYPVFAPAIAIFLYSGKAYSDEYHTNEITVEGITYSEGTYVFEDVNLPIVGFYGMICIQDYYAKIELKGDNQLGVKANTENNNELYYALGSLYAGDNLVITGDGNLTTYSMNQGINAENDITFDDGFTGILTSYDNGGNGGACCICSDNGSVTIKNGTFSLNNTNSYGISGVNVNISGGNINAKGSDAAIYASNTLTLTGMNISGANETYVINEVNSLTNKAGTDYVTLQMNVVCKIGDHEYSSIANALNAAHENEGSSTPTAITLVVDTTENITIGTGRYITLDLNGHVLSGNSTVTGAAITNCGWLNITDSSPSAVHYFNYVSDGVWTLNDAADSQAKASASTIGAINDNTALVKVFGGCITGGTGYKKIWIADSDLSYGGGIYNLNTITLGAINVIGNRASYGGGVNNHVALDTGKLVLDKTVIAGNFAEMAGGGIDNYELVVVSGASIMYNNANDCGGIFNRGQLEIKDGTIIKGNKTTLEYPSAGVYSYNVANSVITLSGIVKIKDNKSSGSAANLCLQETTVVLDGFSSSSDIGVSTLDSEDKATAAAFTNNTATATTGFSPDSSAYYVRFNADHLELAVVSKGTSYVVYYNHNTCVKGYSCVLTRFNDVVNTEWYHDGLHYCVERGYMQGYDLVTLGPNDAISRAMVVRILWNVEGKPSSYTSTTYTDAEEGSWYYDALCWAEANNIVDGYGDGTFGPEDSITREQLAKILYTYAKYKGYDTEKTSVLTLYTDRAKVSSWALDSMKWANAMAIVNGKGNGILDPLGYASRAEAACMVQRLCEHAR